MPMALEKQLASMNFISGASLTATVDDFYATGVILSRENDHIWSFVAGTGTHISGSRPARCPCVQGEDNFIMQNGADLPSFLNGDYFCEAPLPNPIDAPLWDGLNCADAVNAVTLAPHRISQRFWRQRMTRHWR